MSIIGTLTPNIKNGDLEDAVVLMSLFAFIQSQVNTNVPTAVQSALQPAGFDRVGGLVGAVNAATPLTKYDLQARAVTLTNAAVGPVTQLNTATLTCDFGLAGPAANGRDQAGAFAINSWIYLYFIWNGTTLATLASTTAPASFTGATLPTGYTHWAFATALRWNAVSNIIPAFTQGSKVFYDITDSGVNRVLSAGVATVMTTVSCGSLIPPNAPFGKFNFILVCNNAGVQTYDINARKTGSTIVGINVCRASVQVASTNCNAVNSMDFPVNTSGQFDYKIDFVPSVSGGAYIDVLGYVIPNGDC